MVALVPNPNPSSSPDKTDEFLQNFPPPAVLLMGEPGTGKTTSVFTCLEKGLEVNILTTEPSGLQPLIGKIRRENPSLINNLHWHAVTPAPANWAALAELADMVTKHDYESISKEKKGIAKKQTAKFREIIDTTAKFICERTGEDLGDVTMRGENSVFVFDSLSGLSQIAYNHTVGYKPNPHMGEWGEMQSLIRNYLYAVLGDRNCYTLVLAHVEIETDEVNFDLKKTMVSTLGKKLAPSLVKMFNEVVQSKRDGTSFFWSTSDGSSVLKTSVLPIASKLKPSFELVVDAYREQKEMIAPKKST